MEDMHETIALAMVSVIPYIILAKFAHWSIILTALLALASLIVTLPFHFMWGFALVPIGGLVAIYAGKKASVSIKRAD